MTNSNPFLNKGVNIERGFTKYLQGKFNSLSVGESCSISLEGLTNKSIKSLLSYHYKGEYRTRQNEGVTWVLKTK